MVEFILGRSGSGKSSKLMENAGEAVRKGKNVVIFVPDQFSFEEEKLRFDALPRVFPQICRVSTFSKEAQDILKKNGEIKPYADDIAKRIIMKHVTDSFSIGGDPQGDLKYYKRQAKKPGFAAFALSVVSELRTAGVTPLSLAESLSADSSRDSLGVTLADKMSDISRIYSAYDSLLTVNLSDRLDDVRRAAQLTAEKDIFAGYEVFFDEFDHFSGDQMTFLRSLIQSADKVTFALTFADTSKSEKERGDRTFDAVRSQIAKIAAMDPAPVYTYCEEVHRCADPPIIVSARDIRQECEWICAEICRLVESKENGGCGARFRDIAIIAPDEEYAGIFGGAVKRYDIPVFTDLPEPLIMKSVVRFAIYTLQALSFSTPDILRYIKSRHVRYPDGEPLLDTEIDDIENLCRRFGMTGKDWKRPIPAELGEILIGGVNTPADRERADKLTAEYERIRANVYEPLAKLRSALENAEDGAQMTKALCSFMIKDMNIERTIKSRCITDHDMVDGKRVPVYSAAMLDEATSLWDAVIEVFESAFTALRGCKMSIEEFREILTDIFTATTTAKPPQVIDSVLVGDPTRSRLTGVKYLFLCGFTQGAMPPPPQNSAAFTAPEAELLSGLGIQVMGDRRSRYAEGLYTIYRCTHIPSEKLYITYPLMSADGQYLDPADCLNRIRKTMVPVTEIKADHAGAEHYCRTEAAAKRYLSDIYHGAANKREREALKKLLGRKDPQFINMLNSVSDFDEERDRHRIDPEAARALMGRESYSPSALYSMNRCAFKYFCEKGLKLENLREREVNGNFPLVGSAVHACMERLVKDKLGKRQELIDMKRKDIHDHVKESLKIYEAEAYCKDFGGSNRFSFQLGKLSGYAVAAAERLRDELKDSSFYPVKTEETLSFPFGRINIHGKLDRLDTAPKDDTTEYARVVDYKHASMALELSDFYSGENLQMFLYLIGVCENNKNYEPSAVRYHSFGRTEEIKTFSEKAEGKEKDSRKAYYKSLPSAGLALENTPETGELKKLDETLTKDLGSYTTKPKELVSPGIKGYVNAPFITGDVYNAIKDYTGSYLGSLVDRTLHGMVSALPNKWQERNCKYCDYRLFCGHFDTRKAAAEDDDDE